MIDSKQIFLTLTTKCNVRCKKCYLPKDKEMSSEILEKALSVLKDFNGQLFVGSGENLIYPHLDHFLTWLNKSTTLSNALILTNGLLLKKHYKILFSQKVKWGVTLDGFRQEEVETIQPNFKLETVKQNIRSIKKHHPHQKIYLNYTLTSKNADSLLNFIQFAGECEIHEIYVTQLRVFEGTDIALLTNFVPKISSSKIQDLFNEALELSSQLGIYLTLPEKKLHYRCQQKPIITVEGNVAYCLGRETSYIGTIWDDDIWENWTNLKEEIKNQEHHEWCTYCENNIHTEGDVLAISNGYKK